MKPGIETQGLHELGKALGKIDKDLRKDLNKELRAIGNTVRDDARADAAKRRKTGREVKGIKTSVKKTYVTVKSSARAADGTNYPKIHEFGGKSTAGPRAVLLPARDRNLAASERALERVLENVLRGF